MMAFSAYRMTYAAIWDWRFNHIPLHRGVPFDFGSPELSDAVFTRRVGWGAGATSGGYGSKHGGYDNGYGGHGLHHNDGVATRKPVGSGVRTSRDADAMV